MGLTTWKGSKVRKGDIVTAKNYLNHDEIDTLNRLVVFFLESAELRVKNRQDITLSFWREEVDKVLEFHDRNVLRNAGSISSEQMKNKLKMSMMFLMNEEKSLMPYKLTKKIWMN